MTKPAPEAGKIHHFIWNYPWVLVLTGIVTGWSIIGLIFLPAGAKVMYDKYQYNKNHNGK